MGFIDYQMARSEFKDDKFMLQIIDCLKDDDSFHLLRNGAEDANLPFDTPNEQYKNWMTVCDGGLLFSTTLLSLNEYDEMLDLSFSTLDEYNTQERRSSYELPSDYRIIAILNYGDPICVSQLDSRVYLWDSQERKTSTVWETFADFLADEYNIAAQMIEEEVLEPIPMKSGEEQYVE